MQRRVVVTGIGLICAVGNTAPEAWKNLLAGKSGMGPITQFDATGYPVTFAAEVKGFDPLNFVDKKESRKMARFIHLALAATREAVDSSGLKIDASNSERVGEAWPDRVAGAVQPPGDEAMVDTGETGTVTLKRGLAQMLKGGVIMDVVTAEQAKIAEEAGAVAVMALERVPSDIRANGGVARMSDPQMIQEIIDAVTIPVMAKARIGHFVEAQVLEAIGVDYVDESEVLTPADNAYHINKHLFKVPFVCGCRDLGEALRRIGEGAAMIRTKGEAGTGNVVEAVTHLRAVMDGLRRIQVLPEEELMAEAKNLGAPYELVQEVHRLGRLPVVMFTAGGIATPADAALMMQLGAEGVFVGSGIFKSSDPARRAKAIVQATTHYTDAKIIAEVSRSIGTPMAGLEIGTIPQKELLATRGW